MAVSVLPQIIARFSISKLLSHVVIHILLIVFFIFLLQLTKLDAAWCKEIPLNEIENLPKSDILANPSKFAEYDGINAGAIFSTVITERQKIK